MQLNDIKAAFEQAYPTIPWVDNPTSLNTRQVAFMAGWEACKETVEKQYVKIHVRTDIVGSHSHETDAEYQCCGFYNPCRGCCAELKTK